MLGYASRALTGTQLKWDVSRIKAWCIVFMLRYFYWAINPKFKHIITTDHAALRWMDSMVKHQSSSRRQLVRFSLEINKSGPHVLKHRPGLLHSGPDAISRLVVTDTSIDGRRDRAGTESPHPNIWVDCLFIRECLIFQVLATQLGGLG